MGSFFKVGSHIFGGEFVVCSAEAEDGNRITGGYMKRKRSTPSHMIIKSTLSDEELAQRQKNHRTIIDNGKLIATSDGRSIRELEEIISSRFCGKLAEQGYYKEKSIKMNIAMNQYIEKHDIKTIEDIDECRDEVRRIIEEEMSFDIAIYMLEDSGKYGDGAEIHLDREHSYLTFSNVKQEIRNDIIIAFGVYKSDIENETKRFITYAYALEEKRIGDSII